MVYTEGHICIIFYCLPLLLGTTAFYWVVIKTVIYLWATQITEWYPQVAQENPRFKVSIAGTARKAELIQKEVEQQHCEQCHPLTFIFPKAVMTCTGGTNSCPRLGYLNSVTSCPQHCICTKAASLHNNPKIGIRSKRRKVAIHSRLYLNAAVEIQQHNVYLELHIGCFRYQTLTIHLMNSKSQCHFCRDTD